MRRFQYAPYNSSLTLWRKGFLPRPRSFVTTTMGPKTGVDFLEYVRTCRQRLDDWRSSGSKDKLRVVIGNEAMDLDSMASSLALAYFYSHVGVTQRLVIPVMHIPRSDMKLRKDNLLALRKIGLEGDSALIYEDEVDLKLLNEKKMLELVLVDHNAISPRRGVLANSVVQIVDHHTDAGKHLSADRYIRVPTGSCCSLVAERIHGSNSAELLESQALNVLLRMGIVIDTNNLKDKVKTTELDTSVLKLLKQSCDVSIESSKLCSELQAARVDMSGLTAVEVLRKDLKYDVDEKERYIFAVATVKATLADVGVDATNMKAFLSDLAEFMDDKTALVDAGFVLCLKDKKVKRLVTALRKSERMPPPPDVVTKILAALKEKRKYLGITVTGSQEEDWPVAAGNGRTDIHFASFNIQQPSGRKQVMPFLKDVFSSL